MRLVVDIDGIQDFKKNTIWRIFLVLPYMHHIYTCNKVVAKKYTCNKIICSNNLTNYLLGLILFVVTFSIFLCTKY
jgi:hypothetical protein